MEALFFRVLTLSITCGAVVGLALLLLPKLKKRYAAKTAYFLWLVLALRLITPFEFALPQATAVTLAPPSTTIQLPPSDRQQPEMAVPGAVAGDGDQLPGAEIQAPNISDPVSSQAPVQTAPESVAEGPTTLSIPRIAAILWLVGCAVVLLWQAGGYLLARRTLMKWAEPADEEELALLKQLAGEKHPALYRASVDTPMMLGLLRPVLLLPLEPMDKEDLTIALCHELAHWKRHDVAYKTLMAAACVIHWFDPLVWLMANKAGQTVEICCDDAVTSGQGEDFRQAYGRALIHTAAVERAIPFTTCFGGGKEQMKERLQNLFVKKKNGPAAVCLFLCAALLMGNLVSCGGQTVPAEPAEPTPTETLSEAFHGLVATVGEESISILPVNWEETEETLLISAEANALPVTYPVDVERVSVLAEPFVREAGEMKDMNYEEFCDVIGLRQAVSSTLRFHPITGERSATTGSVFLFVQEEGGITSIIETGEYLNLTGMEVAHPVTYTNDTYGFSLNLPGYWEGKYEVKETEGKLEFLHKDGKNNNRRLFYLEIEDPEQFQERFGVAGDAPTEIQENVGGMLFQLLGTGEGKVYFIFNENDIEFDIRDPEIIAEYEQMEQGVPYIGPEDFYFYGTGASLQGNTFVNLTYDFSIDLPESWDDHVSVMMSGDEHAQFFYDLGHTMLYLMDISVHEEESVPDNARTVLLGQYDGVWVYGYLGMTDLPGMSLLSLEKQELFQTMIQDRETVGPEDITFFQKKLSMG